MNWQVFKWKFSVYIYIYIILFYYYIFYKKSEFQGSFVHTFSNFLCLS